MDRKKLNEIMEMNKKASFPTGMCCSGERCSDCRHINMGSMDGSHRCHCRERGRWVYPSDPACAYFKW